MKPATRLYLKYTPLSFWGAIKQFLRIGKWSRTKQEWIIIRPDDPDYDKAPYEVGIVYLKRGIINGQARWIETDESRSLS